MSLKAQRDFIYKKVGYCPSPEQAVIHESPARIKLVAGGERAGKSYSASVGEYMGRFWETPLLWLVAQDYERTRAEFDYICESFMKLGYAFEATKRVDPGEINVSGKFIIQTKSAKDPRRIAVTAPDGIIGCEASQLDYETYLRLLGRAAEKRAWILLSGTFESSLGWYPSLYSRWSAPNAEGAKSFSLPTWSNRAIFPGGREDPEIKRLELNSSPEWFMERYGGIPCPPKGLVFDGFRNEIHTGVGDKFDFEPIYPCYLWVDPGYAHNYSVLVAQKKGEEIWIVDELYEQGLVTSQIIVAAKQKPWFNKVTGGAIDIAGTQHQGMPAPAEIWQKEGHVYLRSQKISIADGIERVKTCFMVDPITNRPKLHINAKCRGLISELGGCPNPHTDRQEVYKYKIDKGGAVLGDAPEDKNNDACKALCYGLVDLLGYTTAKNKRTPHFF